MKTFKAGQLAFFISRFPAPSDIPPTRSTQTYNIRPDPHPPFHSPLHSPLLPLHPEYDTQHRSQRRLASFHPPVPVISPHLHETHLPYLSPPPIFPLSIFPNLLHNSTTLLVHVPLCRPTFRLHTNTPLAQSTLHSTSSLPPPPAFCLHTSSQKFLPPSLLLAETVSTDTLTATHIISTHDTPRSPLCPPPTSTPGIPHTHSLVKSLTPHPSPSLHLAETVSTNTLTTTRTISTHDTPRSPLLLFPLPPTPPRPALLRTQSPGSALLRISLPWILLSRMPRSGCSRTLLLRKTLPKAPRRIDRRKSYPGSSPICQA